MEDDSTKLTRGKDSVLRLSDDDFHAIKYLLCPYCRAGLPDTYQREEHHFVHFIPGTHEFFSCCAIEFRKARGCLKPPEPYGSPPSSEESDAAPVSDL